MGIHADHQFAGPDKSVIDDHLVSNAGLCVVEYARAEPGHFLANQSIVVGNALAESRLMMIDQEIHLVLIPQARNAFSKPRLYSQLVHIHEMVMAHRAINARVDKVAGLDGLLREVVTRQQLFCHGLAHLTSPPY